ncbi:gluconokinase [Nocardioides mesophilus]|uniref:Gluconokinase n=2 Tax=Nocardioides mesophilus TaxID=433659 RepID=A0A7G9RGQ3_9ACTN|nr:gluconokinase [Nocardioides mesophilus]
MGVSGTGKTSVGERIADRLGLDFVEGDSHHPQVNIDKMTAGTPLTDEDRMPWLRTLAALVGERYADGRSTVLTCSALRRGYRDVLRTGVPRGKMFFVHLHAPFAVLEQRMTQRTKHFMPTSLLQSQVDTLEPLEADEPGVVVDVTPGLDEVVRAALAALEPAEPRA